MWGQWEAGIGWGGVSTALQSSLVSQRKVKDVLSDLV